MQRSSIWKYVVLNELEQDRFVEHRRDPAGKVDRRDKYLEVLLAKRALLIVHVGVHILYECDDWFVVLVQVVIEVGVSL